MYMYIMHECHIVRFSVHVTVYKVSIEYLLVLYVYFESTMDMM